MLGQGLASRRKEFETVALPHLDALYATAVRLTRDEREAEDLVQDTVLKAYRFFEGFEPGTNCRAWLYKILSNTFINRYRRGQREREIKGEVALEERFDAFLSADAERRARDPEGLLLGKLEAAQVRRALDQLPADFRLAVLLCDLEEFSYKEIAEIMECPVGTVMSRLYRGRRLLQQLLRARPDAGAEPGPIPLEEYRRRRRGG